MSHSKIPRDRVVIVTGASSGIGRATAIEFARDGARLVLAARDRSRLERVAEEVRALRAPALVVPTDMTRRDQVAALVCATKREYDALHVLVNNAGRGLYATVDRLKEEDLDALLRLNLYGPLFAMQEVIPLMKAQGCGQIINITSTLGRVAIPLMAAYCISKFALEALSASARVELRPHGIDVLVVGPGLTATDFQTNASHQGFAKSPSYSKDAGAPPESVARAILRASKRRRRHTYLTFEANTLLLLHRLFPGLVDFGMGTWMKKALRRHASESGAV